MRELILYKAIVIDDNDSDKLGKVKIKVLPEMKDVKDEDLPWALPFLSLGMNSTTFTHIPPIKNTHIWIFFLDTYFQKPYYITGRIIEGLYKYDDNIKTPLSNITEIGSLTYPNPRAILLPDNSLLFYNTETKEKGIYNQNGTYFFINATGEIYIYSKDKLIKMYNDSGSFTLKASGQLDINGHLTIDP